VIPEELRGLIDEAAAGFEDELIALRRTVHRQPELAGHEEKTAALVAERLQAAGLEVSTGVGGHGVVGVLDGAGSGSTIAYRSDMDAVLMSEESGSEFRSQVAGVGHLCGHDIHTAVGVGVARVLAHVRDRLNGRVIFYFQPAEETLAGAQAMIDDGILEGTLPAEIYALHCAHIEVGTFAVMPGVGLPGHDNFDLRVHGPHASDKVRRLTSAVEALSTVTMPSTPEEHQHLLTEMQLENGPLGRFVFAGAQHEDSSQTNVRGWVKAWPHDSYADIRERIVGLVREICGPEALDHLTFRERIFPAMVSSPDLSLAAAHFFRATIASEAVTELRACFPFNGEDFALFLDRIPGAMFFLGVANRSAGIDGIVHTPTFAADERAIGIGTRAMAGWLATRLTAFASTSVVPRRAHELRLDRGPE
jgi:amidohydrolase